jgi:DNA ligase-1
MLPTLYGKASTGKIKQWSVTTDGADVVVSYGQVGGKIAGKRTTSKPKNIGKANETTGAEQALLEAQSKWNKQLKKDYRESIADIPQSTLPNLAHKYQDKSHVIDWDQCWELPKLDGVRASSFYKNGGQILQSRGGEEYPVIGELAEELNTCFFNAFPDSFVDGELYCHGMYLEDITSCVKKHNVDTKKIKLHVFDWLRNKGDARGWYERYVGYKVAVLSHHAVDTCSYLSRVDFVKATRVTSSAEMLAKHNQYVAEGFEGIILRDSNEPYSFGNRTTGIIKYKVPMSEEFEVVDFELDKNGAGVPVCKIEYTEEQRDNFEELLKLGQTGSLKALPETFKAPFATTAEKRKALWADRANLVGSYLTVDYEKRSKYSVPTKPIGKAFRTMDEDGNPTT